MKQHQRPFVKYNDSPCHKCSGRTPPNKDGKTCEKGCDKWKEWKSKIKEAMS